MALQWCDDFNSYGTNTAFMLNGLYAFVNETELIADPDPNATGLVARFVNGVANHREPKLRKALSSTQTTVGVCCRLWCYALPSGADRYPVPIVFSDVDNNLLFELRMLSTGALVAHNYVTGLSYTATTPSVVANAWQHIEMKAVVDSVAGSLEVRVEGVTVVSATGLNTGTVGIAQVRVDGERQLTQGFPTFNIKDYVVWDGSGSQNNDFLGSVIVRRLVPNADVSLNWTPSTGSTGFNLINVAPPVDTNYISAADTLPAAAVFDFTDLPTDITSVRGLMTLARARKTDGGDGNLQQALISGASTDNGADRPVTTAFTYWYDWSELNPATGVPWVPVEVDNMEGSLDRTI